MEPFLESRRRRVAEVWDLSDEIVLLGSGQPVPIPGGADQTYPFRAHYEYLYLTDRDRPGCVLAFDPYEGWVDFVPEITEKERIWGGDLPAEGTPLTGLEPWLAARRGRSVAVLGSPVPDVEADAELGERLRETLTHARRPKDEAELERMRLAARITETGYARLRGLIRPGVTERRLQIELEAELCRHGARRPAYESIVGSGPNSAVFHFSPSERVLRDGELVLIDAGAEVGGYACDVTRTYPAGAGFTPEQRDLYQAVLEPQKRAVAKCRAGVEFRDLHLETSADLTRGLIALGLVRGEPQSLVEQGVTALFFPHGLGHLVGLGVRDASGRLPGREKDERPGLENLRLDLPLEPGYVVTIEPGLYFVPALLESRERREKFPHQVDWQRVDRWLGTGGVRIEDNVLVTPDEPEVLTAAIPKELWAQA
jgi:Xaa-Pro aminopeptidase